MSLKRFMLALVVTIVAVSAADILLNAVILRSAFAAASRFWRPTEELNALVPVGLLALSGTTAVYGGLLVRSGWIGVRRGAQFGAWLGLASGIGVLGLSSLVPWPLSLIVAMAIQQVVNAVLGGIIFGWFAGDARRSRAPEASGAAA